MSRITRIRRAADQWCRLIAEQAGSGLSQERNQLNEDPMRGHVFVFINRPYCEKIASGAEAPLTRSLPTPVFLQLRALATDSDWSNCRSQLIQASSS